MKMNYDEMIKHCYEVICNPNIDSGTRTKHLELAIWLENIAKENK